jgi:hypothetical protein
MQSRNVYPIPEAIDGKRWEVADGRPRVDLTRRQLFAPLADTDEDRFLRAHEMAHARITPKTAADRAARKAGVSLLAAQVCEDRRVHEFLSLRRIPRPGALSAEETAAMVAKLFDRPRDLAAALVSASGTGDFDRIAHAADAERMKRGFPVDRWVTFLRYVEAVTDAVTLPPAKRGTRHPATTAAGFRTRTVPAAKLFDELFPERSDGDDPAASAARAMIVDGARYAGRSNRWGSLKPIERSTMPLCRRPDRRGVAKRFHDSGVIPTAVHRLTTDGRIFGRKKKREKGGTVLVDFSGSMGLSPEALRRIIDAAPAAKVAVYSGRGSSGRLVIVADRGRCADADGLARSSGGGGNVVDGPALRWLAGQAEPRVWVSDGIVTGVGDNPGGNLFSEAAACCRSAGIIRVLDAAGAIAAVK